MKIPLHGISEEGLDIPFDQTNKELKAELKQYLKDNDFSGEIELRPAGEHFHFKGHLNSELMLECSFCNEMFDYIIDEEFQEILAPEWEGKLKGAKNPKELFEADVELITGMEGEDFNIGTYLTEIIEFALPAHPKCTDECKGLCTHCGKNLNKTTCSCTKEQQAKSLAFSGLRDLKIDKKH